jgi:hypothetical protein
LLVELELDGDATGLSGLVVSDPNAQSLYFEYFEGGSPEIEGCMDVLACNYNSDATVDDGSCLEDDCAGECGGSATEDCAGVCGGSAENCPDWEVDPGAYEFTATIAGVIVLLDGVLFAEEGDVFAAFDESGNVRGVAVQLIPPFGPYEGQIVYELQIYSNAEGDLISFQYYHHEAKLCN